MRVVCFDSEWFVKQEHVHLERDSNLLVFGIGLYRLEGTEASRGDAELIRSTRSSIQIEGTGAASDVEHGTYTKLREMPRDEWHQVLAKTFEDFWDFSSKHIQQQQSGSMKAKRVERVDKDGNVTVDLEYERTPEHVKYDEAMAQGSAVDNLNEGRFSLDVVSPLFTRLVRQGFADKSVSYIDV